MKRKNIVSVIAVAAVVAVAMFAGCVEEEKVSTSIQQQKYVAGDIVGKSQSSSFQTIINSYNQDEDQYEIKTVYRNKDGCWEQRFNLGTRWMRREFIEVTYPTLIDHVDLSTVIISEPRISATPTPVPTWTPTLPPHKGATVDRIEGLAAIKVGGGTWDNWDADIEKDGPVVKINYLDARGGMIYDKKTGKMPVSADVKLYAGDDVTGPRTKIVFSAHFTEDEVIRGRYYPEMLLIYIPKEEISVDPSTDYRYGAVEATIYTPKQGTFADRDDFFVLYEE